MKVCTTCKVAKPATSEHFTIERRKATGLTHRCRDCTRAYNRQYRKENKKAVSDRERLWKKENRAHVQEYMRGYKSANLERIQALRAGYEQRLQADKLRRTVRLARKRAYRAENKGKWRVYAANRRASKRNAPGSFTEDDVLTLLERQQGKCSYCKNDLQHGFHMDHVIPLSRPELNPRNDISNLACACDPCNRQKASKTPSEWQNRWYQ